MVFFQERQHLIELSADNLNNLRAIEESICMLSFTNEEPVNDNDVRYTSYSVSIRPVTVVCLLDGLSDGLLESSSFMGRQEYRVGSAQDRIGHIKLRRKKGDTCFRRPLIGCWL